MLSFFYLQQIANRDPHIESHKPVPNFMNVHESEHASVTYGSRRAKEQKEIEKQESSKTDFISFYDIFGAFNY